MKRSLVLITAFALAVGLVGAASAETWDGAPDGGGTSADTNWSTDDNWVGDLAPTNPTAGTITFGVAGAADTEGVATGVLDPQNTGGDSGTWSIGTLTLDAPGKFHTIRCYDDAGASAKSLVVDSAATLVEGTIAFTEGSFGLGAGADLTLGTRAKATAVLDLTASNVVGNVLRVNNLSLTTTGSSNRLYNNPTTGEIRINDSTGLTKIQVDNDLMMGCGPVNGSGDRDGRMGDPDNDWKLPANVDVQVGSVETPGKLWIGAQGVWWSNQGSLVASGGGTFTANLTELRVGEFIEHGAGHVFTHHNGTLDLRAMNDCTLQTDLANIGVVLNDPASTNEEIIGQVYLPSGTAVANTLEIGTSYAMAGATAGLLQLEGTVFTVNDSLTVAKTGTVNTLVNGFSCGLDLTDAITLDLHADARLNVTFEADQDGGESGEYWGMRWAGNHQADMSQLVTSGQLVVDDSLATGTYGFFYDGAHTYLSVRETWPPVAIARNLTVEIRTPTQTTVVIDLGDIDVSPDDLRITGRSITCPDDTDAQPDTVTLINLVAPSSYEITLTLTSTEGDATATSTVDIIELAAGTGNDLTWSGGARMTVMPRDEWLWGQNWVGNVPPAAITVATLTFGDAGTGDNSIAENREIGALSIMNTIGAHATDLGGNTLTVANAITMSPPSGGANMSFANGTLQLGTATAANVSIGRGTLAIGCNVDTQNVGTVTVGTAATGVLDLTGAQAAVFEVATLLVAGSAATTTGHLILKPSTAIGTLSVTDALVVGSNKSRVVGRIGDPDNDWKLPQDISLSVGTPGVPGKILMATVNAYWSNEGHIVAYMGGSFTANLSELTVGQWPSAGVGHVFTWHRGTLDLGAMNDCDVQIDAAKIGVVTGDPGGYNRANEDITGIVSLPPGTASANTLEIGNSYGFVGEGTLTLQGTVFTVNNSLTIGANGTVNTNVNGKSCGLDFPDAIVLDIHGDARLNVTFEAEQDGGESGEYWGMRWAGDHRSDMLALQADGKLVVDDSLVTGTAGFTFDGTHTYLALRESWPPAVVAKNLTVEIQTPTNTTVVIDVGDIDASPDDVRITGRGITCPDDTDANPQTVTLTGLVAPSSYEITLTLTTTEGDVTDTSTVDIVELAAGTTGDLTWSGGARMTVMGRTEWLWGRNWVGGVPPVPITAATLTFGDAGTGDNSIAENREIGTLSVINTTGTHATDLGGNRLTVAGAISVNPSGGAADMSFTNGTLQIGAADAHIDVQVATASEITGRLTVSGGATVETHIGTLTVGGTGNSEGFFDLGTAHVGTFSADNIKLGQKSSSYDINPGGKLIFTENSLLTDIEVVNLLAIGDGTMATGRMGDPNNGWALPSNVNIKVGVDADNRGTVAIGRVGWHGADGYLAATSGGTFQAYLTELSVSVGVPGWNSWPGRIITGTLDIENMASCSIDATTVTIGLGDDSTGVVRLPGGTVTTADLAVGDPSMTGSSGLLSLKATEFRVTNSVTVNQRGTVTTNLDGTSGGLDLAAGATLTVNEGGLIDIVFGSTAPLPGIYWGLRAEGDRVLELEGLFNEVPGKLTWDDTLLTIATGKTVSIFKDDTHTYVGVSTFCDGDVNGDNKVNILDLIGVRNHLNQEPSTPPENAVYDLNKDGKINILDMIYVRNRLNQTCD